MRPLACGRCNYDLTGLPQHADTLSCPECGNVHRIVAPTFQKTYLDLNCRRCGYSLEGLDRTDGSALCPECGFTREPNEPDSPGVMPRFGRALTLIIAPVLVLWTIARLVDTPGPATGLASLVFLTAATVWGMVAPVIVARRRGRRYAARPRLIFDEIAVGYVTTLLAAFIFGLLLLVLR